MKKNNYKIHIFFIYLITFIFLELIFRIYCTENLLPLTTIYTLIYSISISLLLSILTSLFKHKNIITPTIIFIITLWYMTNVIYKLKMAVFFSINSIGLANQLTSFWKDTINTLGTHYIKLLIMLLPFILILLKNKKIKNIKIEKKEYLKYIITFMLTLSLFYCSLLINKNKEYSIYKLYFKISNNPLIVEKTGVLISTNLEIKEKIFK